MNKYSIIYNDVEIEIILTEYNAYRCILTLNNIIRDVVIVATSLEAIRIVTKWQIVHFNKVYDKNAIIRIGELKI